MVCPEGLDIVDRQAFCVKSPYNFLLILKHLVSVCSSDIKVLLIELFLNKWITLFSLISFLPFAFNLASSLPMYIIVLLLSLLLYNSLFLSVRNALGEMWFFLLLFKMDGWFFLWRFPLPMNFRYKIYFVRRSASHATKYQKKYVKQKVFVILSFATYGCCHPCLIIKTLLNYF